MPIVGDAAFQDFLCVTALEIKGNLTRARRARLNPGVRLARAASAFCLAAAVVVGASACGSSGQTAAPPPPSVPAPGPPPTQPQPSVPTDAPSSPRAAAISSRLAAAGYAVHASAQSFRRPPGGSDDSPRSGFRGSFGAPPRATLTVTDPDDDRRIAVLRRRLYAVDSAVSQQQTMATAAQTRQIQALVAAIQNKFRVEVAVYRSAAEAAADRRDAPQPFTTPTNAPLVSRVARKGAVVYRMTVAEDVGDRYDVAFRRLIAAGEGA